MIIQKVAHERKLNDYNKPAGELGLSDKSSQEFFDDVNLKNSLLSKDTVLSFIAIANSVSNTVASDIDTEKPMGITHSAPFMWATGAHNYFIDLFSNKYGFSTSAVKSIKEGSKDADSLKYQFGGSAHMHAMGNGVNTPEEQEQKMNNFINQKMENYRNLLDKAETASNNNGGRMKSKKYRFKRKAYHELGMALHTAMDSTSPAHEGFQVWSWNKETVSRHGDFKTSIESLDAAQREENTKNTIEAMDKVMDGIDF